MEATGVNPADDAFWQDDAAVALANPRDPAAAEAMRDAMSARLVKDRGPDTVGGKPEAGEGESGGPVGGLVHFLTSGSSGRPKVVGFTRAALLASARAVNEFLGVTADSVWLRVLPRFHVGGFQVEARAWAAGATVVSSDAPWNPHAFADLCATRRITHTSLVPAQVFDIIEADLRAPDSLRVALVGGGELRPVLARRAAIRGWHVRASYGLTEAASTVAIQTDGETDFGQLTVLPHWQTEVGVEDRLSLRGPALPARTAQWDAGLRRYRWQAFEPPLHTNDRVLLRGGMLVFLGRADRVVKRLGELIDLAQIDRALADAAVAVGAFGRVRLRCKPDARDGHRLVLECLDAAEGAAVAARFNASQPPFARIPEIRAVTDLRLSALGKPLA